MMPSKNNGFTASDIERYHSGNMSPEERHALEKAALDDPFLADALEGYAFTSAPSDDLAKIQSRLDEKRDHKKVVHFFQKYKWLSVAALVLIIAGAGWLVFSISAKENNSVATTQEMKRSVKDSNLNTIPLQKKSGDSIDHLTMMSQHPEGKQTKNLADKKIVNKDAVVFPKKEESEKKGIVTNNHDEKKELPDEQTFSAVRNKTENNNELSHIQQKEINKNRAISTTPQTNNNVTKGYNKNPANDVAAKGKVPATANDTIKDLNIVLQPLPKDSMQSLQEVVVVGYGAQKKSSQKYPRVVIDTLEPAEGYVNFDDYVANNLQLPDEIRTKTISGDVQLSFDVDKDGQPTNITVVKSLCQKCDEEAIRLLKEGPKWKKKKNKMGKITIRF